MALAIPLFITRTVILALFGMIKNLIKPEIIVIFSHHQALTIVDFYHKNSIL